MGKKRSPKPEYDPNRLPVSDDKAETLVINRSSRVVHMLQLLSLGRGYTAEELSEIYDLDPRSIKRDLKLISEQLHVAITYDRSTKKYEILDTRYVMPSVGLTTLEAVCLVILCREFGMKKTVPFFEVVHSAALKIQSHLSPETCDYIEQTYQNVDMTGAPFSMQEDKRECYMTLQDASRTHNVLEIEYNSYTEEEKIKTLFYPYAVVFNRHGWMAVGYSALHNQIRMFNVLRIVKARKLNLGFERPKDWTYEKYLRNAWNVIPENGPDWHVVVDFSFKVGRNVEEIYWHKNQKTHWINDRTLRFETVVSGLNEISWWILGYGAEATVVEPKELRQIIAGHVKRLAQTYGNELGKSSR